MKHKTVLSFNELRDEYINEIRPRTANQKKYWNMLADDSKSIVIAHGPAGCGKTLLATQNGIDLMKLQKIEKIVVTRPVVGADEDIGFLPGTLNKKMEPWTRPLYDIFHKNYTVNRVKRMVNEMQNTTVNQFKMLLTRIGEGSKLVITGDLGQTDRGKENGMKDFLTKLKAVESKYIFDVQLHGEDIQRHHAVTEALSIYGD